MKIWKIIKNFITCKPKVKPIKISPVDEKELTKREEGKEIDKIPEDEFLCPKCDMIPEILEVNLDTGKLTMNCKNHGKITRFATKYIDELLNSHHTYLDNKCRYCNRKSKRSTIDKLKYCTICRQNICVECAANIDMEHQINLAQGRIWNQDYKNYIETEKENTRIVRDLAKKNLSILDAQVKMGKYDVDKTMSTAEREMNLEILRKAAEM